MSDTILVVPEGPPEVISKKTGRSYKDITYLINDEDDEEILSGEEEEKSGEEGREKTNETRTAIDSQKPLQGPEFSLD